MYERCKQSIVLFLFFLIVDYMSMKLKVNL